MVELTFGTFQKQLLLTDIGDFVWNFANEFFITTTKGNYVWSSPDYGGDNTIKKTEQTYEEWIGEGSFGRSKGQHTIQHYCGEDVKIIQ